MWWSMSQDANKIIYHRSMLLYEIQWIKTSVQLIVFTEPKHKKSNTMSNIVIIAKESCLYESYYYILQIIVLRLTYSWDCFVEAIIAEALSNVNAALRSNAGYKWGVSSKGQPLQYTSSLNVSIVRKALKDAEACRDAKDALLMVTNHI